MVDCAPAVSSVVLPGSDRKENIALLKRKLSRGWSVDWMTSTPTGGGDATYFKYSSPEISRIAWRSLGK